MERWTIPANVFVRHLPSGWTRSKIGSLVRQVNERIRVEPEHLYKMAGVRWYGEGVFHRETVKGSDMSASQIFPLVPGALIYNRLFAWKASFAVVPISFSDCFVSNEFPQFTLDTARVLPEYLYLFLTREAVIRAVNSASTGSAAVSRNRFKEEAFLEFEIPLPPLSEQRAIIASWQKARDKIAAAQERVEKRASTIDARFLADLGLTPPKSITRPKAFATLWKDIERWGVEQVFLKSLGGSKSSFPELRLSELCEISSGGTPSRSRPDYFGGAIPWVKTTEVQNEVITRTEETLSHLGLTNSSARLYPAGSLIVAMYGQGATRGRTAKLGIEAATNQACAVLHGIDKRVETDFLWYFLMSQYEAMRSLASGNNQPNLNAEMISNLMIPVPPLNIQQKMIAYMEKGRNEIARERENADRLAETINTEIENLVLGTKKASEQ